MVKRNNSASNGDDFPPPGDDQPYAIPANLNLERALIGSIFLDQDAIDKVEFLSPDDFYGGQHADIFRRMRKAWADGLELNPFMVAGQDQDLFFICNEAISNELSSSRFIMSYARQIKTLAQKRRYLGIASTLAGYAANGKTPQDIADYLMAEIAAQEAVGVDNPFDRWADQGITAAEAAGAEPIQRCYVVEDLIREKSVTVVFGAPGALKSALMMDMAICIANGTPWLQRLPVEGNDQKVFATRQARVLWLNYDQGHDDVVERLGAMARVYGGGENVTAISHSTPPAILETERQARSLGEYCERAGYRVIVVDSLLDVKGKADLQEAGMGDVLRMWRIVAEVGELAVIIISHSTKLTTDLYGSQFIKAKLDHLYRVTRPAPDSPTVIIESEKQRSYGETGKLFARWTYQHREGTRTLKTARFWGDSTEQRTVHPNNTTQQAVLAALMASPGRGHKAGDLATILNAGRDEGEKLTESAVRHAVERLFKVGTVSRTETENGAFLYRYGELAHD